MNPTKKNKPSLHEGRINDPDKRQCAYLASQKSTGARIPSTPDLIISPRTDHVQEYDPTRPGYNGSPLWVPHRYEVLPIDDSYTPSYEASLNHSTAATQPNNGPSINAENQADVPISWSLHQITQVPGILQLTDLGGLSLELELYLTEEALHTAETLTSPENPHSLITITSVEEVVGTITVSAPQRDPIR